MSRTLYFTNFAFCTCARARGWDATLYGGKSHIIDHRHASFGVDSSRRSIIRIFLVESPEMLSLSGAGFLCAPHCRRHKKCVPPPSPCGDCLFKKFDDSALQNLACKRMKFIFGEVPCSACHVHRVPRKSLQARFRPEGLCTPKIFRTFFSLDSGSRAQDLHIVRFFFLS